MEVMLTKAKASPNARYKERLQSTLLCMNYESDFCNFYWRFLALSQYITRIFCDSITVMFANIQQYFTNLAVLLDFYFAH